MKKKKSLKEQNNPLIYSFIILNIVVGYLFLFINSPTIDGANEFLDKITAKQGIFTLLIPFLALILTSIISSDTKAQIIFLRISNPLPGSRAFSKYILKDPRINREKLEIKYSPFPKDQSKQNSLWYKIYKKNIEKITVVESHKKFLLTRDLAVISFILSLIFPIVWFFSKTEFTNSFYYLLYLLIQFVLLNLSAKNLGIRFTCNVLTEESNN